ncbi:DeoR/GlpR family DNA-binding transcription regulator [Chthonobacter albigriseus]|uniref:DeoR/GlpR family DNA-binding transcription regulator n=1 Tax=Chthonobacter albigriseus TaxID=1683161 RepID=UPI0015EEC10E|nr:DeoR/GlpR family DNA-binding transcription regulator [Chthonobacter albigriseus]
MRHTKRHEEILRIVREEGTSTVAKLAERLGVSLETIRRDVQPLADRGALVKMHGAVALPDKVGEAPFDRRMREMAQEKRQIAKRVAELVVDGDTLILDTGTTTSFVARALVEKRELTVVTNSPDIARTMGAIPGNIVHLAGGRVHPDNGATFGVAAIDFVRQFRVHHAIITVGGMHAGSGITDYALEEAEFARAVLASGERRMVVTDHTKFGRHALARVCGLDGVDCVVTDRAPQPDLLAALEAAAVEVILPE